MSGAGGGDGEGDGAGPGGLGTYGVLWGIKGGPGVPGDGAGDTENEIHTITNQIEAPVLLKRVQPDYPHLAVLARREGDVILEGVIGLDGRIESIRVLHSVPLLDEAALHAVRQWVYTPARMSGRPVRVFLTIKITFRVD